MAKITENQTKANGHPKPPSGPSPGVDKSGGWQKGYRKSSFAPAFFFLSKERRQALQILYSVCRVLDDAVDHGQKDPALFLEAWKQVFLEETPEPVQPYGKLLVAREFLAVAKEFGIPTFAMVDLIEKGVGIDLKTNRFQTPMDTESYCYGVAGTVGIACLPIFGVPVPEGRDFAVRLGIAIQWINIVRDVGPDAQMGRIYLPLDHLEQFGYTESEVFGSKNSAEFKSLMEYEAKVARMHFKRACELMPMRWFKELLPARIMGRLYMALLKKIERKGFPVFEKKVTLGIVEKALVAFKELRM